MRLGNRLAAEFIGTFWLVLGGCGSAVLAASFPKVGIGLLGVALAFGLTVLTMGVRRRSHLRRPLQPRRHDRAAARQALRGPRGTALHRHAGRRGHRRRGRAVHGASGKPGFSVSDGFAANGYGSHSPGGYSLAAALVIEIVMTAGFLLVILGVTDRRAPKGFGPLAIGLALTLIHLVSIPVTNTSVNPARSTGQALFVGGWALGQLWLFWLAPLVGAAIAGLGYRYMTGETGVELVARTGQDPDTAVTTAGVTVGTGMSDPLPSVWSRERRHFPAGLEGDRDAHRL